MRCHGWRWWRWGHHSCSGWWGPRWCRSPADCLLERPRAAAESGSKQTAPAAAEKKKKEGRSGVNFCMDKLLMKWMVLFCPPWGEIYREGREFPFIQCNVTQCLGVIQVSYNIFISFKTFSYTFHTGWWQVKANRKWQGRTPMTSFFVPREGEDVEG